MEERSELEGAEGGDCLPLLGVAAFMGVKKRLRGSECSLMLRFYKDRERRA